MVLFFYKDHFHREERRREVAVERKARLGDETFKRQKIDFSTADARVSLLKRHVLRNKLVLDSILLLIPTIARQSGREE